MSKENKTGLPASLKSGIESLSGMSMDDVRVHYNSPKPAQLNALAYAQGNEIHLGTGQERHLPHEAWHVVQQRQGRVKPTMQMAGSPVNDEPSLEDEVIQPNYGKDIYHNRLTPVVGENAEIVSNEVLEKEAREMAKKLPSA